MLRGDEAVVNCVQCHPYDCIIATSGIDSTIKIWTPNSPVPSIVAGGAAGPETSNVLAAMEENQRRLCRTWEAILPFEILERYRMHEFAEGRFHPRVLLKILADSCSNYEADKNSYYPEKSRKAQIS
ncbi:protein ALTERED SEED GERMINATION 2-like [Primulina tabacum]|uniref:protein ALTERED SEED GERMINATION 2-like n=1 Tax=Primulina tabacum TaxID=48773 RepID=UPI003F5A92F4